MTQVPVARIRPELTKWIDYVQRPERWVILTAHGREVAALVSVENLKLIWNQQDERTLGPINPASGRPFGSAWVSEHFQGQYERHRDPEAHLHPRREEAPWLGRPFEWPPKPLEEKAEAPAPGRAWWRFWR